MKNICSIFFIMLFLAACDNAPQSDLRSGMNDRNLHLNAVSLSPTALSNIQVYAFNGAYESAFSHRVHTMTQSGNILSMVIPADTWNFVLLSTESGPLGQPFVPTVGSQRGASKMWTCPNDGIKMLSAPEIITARTGSVQIVAGAHEDMDISLTRNVSMITVKINDVAGINASGTHKISLLDVPESLTWDGGLYPSKTNPDVSLLPMSGAATLYDHPTLGTQYSDGVTFLVPAHQGIDFLSEEPGFPKDTTTHCLRIEVDLELPGGGRLVRDAVLPIVPKANRRLEVGLRVGSNLEVTASIHDWVDHNRDTDLSNTTLVTSKTSVGLSSCDTIYVQTNAMSGYTAVSEASWLNVVSDGNRIYLDADTESYFTEGGTPRSGYVIVRANNLVKRIKVTQRPDVGTITHSISDPPHSFWVSPTSGNVARTVSVTSTGPWELMRPSVETVTTPTSGGPAGTTPVTFTRKAHVGFIPEEEYGNYYGATEYKLKNKKTLEVITLTAHNLYLEVDDINVPNTTGVLNTKENINVFTYFGMSGDMFVVDSKPDWLTSVTIDPNGNITLSAYGSPDGEERDGQITFSHKDDPTYKVTITVTQDFYTDIPAFHYFVIKFTWIGSGTVAVPDDDAEVWVQFEDTWRSTTPTEEAKFDNIGLGYNSPTVGSSAKYITLDGTSGTFSLLDTSKGLMFWGSDATGGQGETIFFNAPMIDNLDSTYPREIKIVVYTYWYTSGQKNQPIRMTVFAYKDGYMVRSRAKATDNAYTNFSNVDGTLLYEYSKSQISDKSCGTSEKNVANMCKAAVITYDRKKHSAHVEWIARELNSPAIPVPDGNPLPPGSNLIYNGTRSLNYTQSDADLQKLQESQNLK